VNDLRYNKIRGKCCLTGETFDASKNIDLGVLPPCRNCMRRALWNWGDFCNVLIGLTFPIPLNALVVSQRVNACRPNMLYTIPAGIAVLMFLMGMPFILQVMMVPAYVVQKLNQLNRNRKKLIHELF
jgi:hypothetical protein